MQARCRQSPDGGGDGEGPKAGGEERVRLREGRQQGESLTGGGYYMIYTVVLMWDLSLRWINIVVIPSILS